jgi:hypothetical protein
VDTYCIRLRLAKRLVGELPQPHLADDICTNHATQNRHLSFAVQPNLHFPLTAVSMLHMQRRAEAYLAIEDFSSAVADLQQLVQLCGGNSSSSSSCREAAVRLRDAQQRQRLQGSAGPNYYAVLGLQQGCSMADVKAAYR